MIGTPKGAGVTGTRYAGLAVLGSVKATVGSVGVTDRKPSGVDAAGTVTPDTDTACGGDGWLRTSGASSRGRTIRPGRSRRVMRTGALLEVLLPDSMFDATLPLRYGPQRLTPARSAHSRC